MKRLAIVLGVAALTAAIGALFFGNDVAIAVESPAASRSIGTISNGRLENGKRLPTTGRNFRAYSRLGALLGRNTVHHQVRNAILDSYRLLEAQHPGTRFVYGETGWPRGGRLRPHRTHQNGLSVDFMVPVRTLAGEPAEIPTPPWLRFGYDVEFDADGRYRNLVIDFDAVADHLLALDVAASKHGLAIQRVIFAPELMELMRQRSDRGGAALQRLTFMEGTPWVRHDEHYHVDFTVRREMPPN